jgi:hypothetical protein
MSNATRDFVNSTVGSFATGYKIGENMLRREGEEEVGDWSMEDYKVAAQEQPPGAAGAGAIPESTLVGPEGDVVMSSVSEPNEEAAYGEGGDAKKVDALLDAESAEGAIDTTEVSGNQIDQALQRQKNIPKVTVFDWEAAKSAKAKAYAKAGMMDKAANIDAEFDTLKQQQFQKYAVRALQTMEGDPAKAAEYLSMASQYNADGTQSVYMPSPDGKLIMEYELDEVTQQPRGQGTPVDKEMLTKHIQMNADPSKFLYTQYDREYKKERDAQADKQFSQRFDQSAQQHRDNLQARYKGMNVDMLIAEQRNLSALEKARIAAGDDTAEGIADFKGDVLKVLTNVDSTVALRGMEEGIKGLKGDGIQTLAAGAGQWRSSNGADLGAAEAIAAEYNLTKAPLVESSITKKDDGYYYTNPDTNITLKIPQSTLGIVKYRIQQAAK